MPEAKPAEGWGEFQISQPQLDWNSGRLELNFGFEAGPDFSEVFDFPAVDGVPSTQQRRVVEACAELLGQMAGVSYYKLGMPDQIRLAGAASEGRCQFIESTYRHGLAELRYRNQLPLPLDLRVQAASAVKVEKLNATDSEIRRVLVAMGGGKDSIVAAEMLDEAGFEVTLAVVGGAQVISSVIERSDLPHLSVERRLDPALGRANQCDGWNGHVPITAINSAALLTLAAWQRFDAVVFANERSANEPTLVTAGGEVVNHQYSKSQQFEIRLQQQLATEIDPGLHYFSLLRPLGELGILERFAGLTTYHDVFSSCNRNFHRDGSRIDGRWCGDCPKCRFTYLGLALFLDRGQLDVIFPGRLLELPEQMPGFRALAALKVEKPFECVGTSAEVRSALSVLSQRADWQHSVVVSTLAAELENEVLVSLEQHLAVSKQHRLPASVAHACYQLV